MGVILPPAPLIPFIQLLIIAYLPFIPVVSVYVIFGCASNCILKKSPILEEIGGAAAGIVLALAAPLFISIILWILFFAQIIAGFVWVLFILVEWFRSFRATTREWPLNQQSKANYPLQWFDRTYEYCSLTGKREIRLLVLYPGPLDDPLTGDIVGADLRWRPTYDALSYTWADEDGDVSLSSAIHCVREDSTIRITKNCEAALRRLRLLKEKRRLWVDAVCINQDSDAERSYQVSLMSDIYMNARHVIAYTGEGTRRTDLLYDWLNEIDVADLNVPSIGMFKDFDVAENSIFYWPLKIWNGKGGAKDWANALAIILERYSRIGLERLLRALQQSTDPEREKVVVSETELDEIVTEYFSRRWFRRVWVLQEVSLPALNKTRVMCGSKITSAARALHLVSLLKTQGSGSSTWVFNLVRRRIDGPRTSHLLDILVETRHRECSDPRDKIFGVLSIAQWMDDGKFPELKANYDDPTPNVYSNFSTFFIRHHGAGFFLSLIKSSPRLQGIPSWSADWTVPWPNHNSVKGIDFAARSRVANTKDTRGLVISENGIPLLVLSRPRILRGYFTRDGHLDDSEEINIEEVQSLEEDEVLIEMYPGLAALLSRVGEYYLFLRVCPHALSEIAVEDLVQRWSRVVVYMEGPEKQSSQNDETLQYLASPEIFEIM